MDRNIGDPHIQNKTGMTRNVTMRFRFLRKPYTLLQMLLLLAPAVGSAQADNEIQVYASPITEKGGKGIVRAIFKNVAVLLHSMCETGSIKPRLTFH